MADEITLNASLAFKKGSADISFSIVNKLIAVAGADYVRNRMAVGTTEKTIPLGGMTTAGLMMFINRDTTNTIRIYPTIGTTSGIPIPAGEAALFRPSTTTPYVAAVSTTGTTGLVLEYLIVEN